MKVYIDVTNGQFTLVGEERESPFLLGSENSNKLRVYFNETPENFYPSLKLLFANGRKKGPILSDVFDSNVEYTETVQGTNLRKPNGDNYATQQWHFFDFTMSESNGILISSGILQMTLIINAHAGDGEVTSQHLINLKQVVYKSTVYERNNAVITVYGDDP